MSARTDQRTAAVEWTSASTGVASTAKLAKTRHAPTARELHFERHGARRGLQVGLALGILFGGAIGALATVLVLSVWRAL